MGAAALCGVAVRVEPDVPPVDDESDSQVVTPRSASAGGSRAAAIAADPDRNASSGASHRTADIPLLHHHGLVESAPGSAAIVPAVRDVDPRGVPAAAASRRSEGAGDGGWPFTPLSADEAS